MGNSKHLDCSSLFHGQFVPLHSSIVPVTSAEIQAQKVELRRSLLRARQGMHPDQWREKSDRLCHHVQQWQPFQEARTVLAFFSARQEPDLMPLFHLPKRWAFPRCEDQAMIWHEWSPRSRYPLQTGSFGISEPHPLSPTITPQQVDVILVPAIACDVRGYRLGYGGGYYDRMLSNPLWSGIPTVGIVFELARLPQLPHAPWDRRLGNICTEVGVFPSRPTTPSLKMT